MRFQQKTQSAAVLLYEVSSHDLTTMFAVMLVVFVVASLAVLLPALRAARTDPMNDIAGVVTLDTDYFLEPQMAAAVSNDSGEYPVVCCGSGAESTSGLARINKKIERLGRFEYIMAHKLG